ncbi:4'-phosphopantetheinyl transferase superfamily protein [Mariniflexile sp.]|uniref:4'-phosphopantetheinyl transferase family protein n=1 Tax=Mariniflexile sp. TaxID=1979402 RepID=UPI003567AFE9
MTTQPTIKIQNNIAGDVSNRPLSGSFKTNLNDASVLIYTVSLADYMPIISVLKRALDLQEVARAHRYYHDTDQHRFIICRGLLKVVLALQTTLHVSEIKLSYDANKKPYLPSHPALFFNVAHSKDKAIIALSQHPVGVDIEYINPHDDVLHNLSAIFSEPEIAYIAGSEEKHRAFYTLWTRKEALVKALGKGIDNDFNKIPTTNGLHRVAASLLGSTESWSVQDLTIASNYAAAIAFKDQKGISETLVLGALPTSINDLIS